MEMPSLIYTPESPETLKEVAKFLRLAAERLDGLADGLKKEGIEEIDIPLKKTAFESIEAIEKWTQGAQGAWLKAKRSSGAMGPEPEKGPRSGKKSNGSGNFRGKKR